MNAYYVQNCEDDKIQYLNEIQDFGYLIGVNPINLEIEFISENISEIIDIDSSLCIGNPISDFFDFNINLAQILKLEEGDYLREVTKCKGHNFHLTFYVCNDLIYIELEDFAISENRLKYHNLSEKILYSKSKKETWKLLVNSVSELVDYDRVMIYKFHEDGSGIVIDEKIKDGIDSYLGLRFPEFDIPAQARELYLKKKSRMVADIKGKRIPLLTKENKAIDLTYSSVRALSPVHLEYLENANSFGSFSISIVINNRLWGIVACQNIKPKYIPNQIRLQSELLTRLARLSYVNFVSNERLEFQTNFNETAIKLKESLLIDDNLQSSVRKNLSKILKLTLADGISIVKNDNVFSKGETPDNSEVLRIKQWAIDNEINDLFTSNSFYLDHHEELNLTKSSCGVMFSFLDQDYRYFFIWFKKEELQNYNWAGMPEKIERVSDDKKYKYFSPRSSFVVWQEEVKGKSFIWEQQEKIIAKGVIKLIVETIHLQSFKIQSLYDQLQEVNEELDSFSYTISHDLRTPLTVMKLNCQMLQKSLNGDIVKSDKLKSVIGEIDRMSEMMKDILELSKAKKSEIILKEIETKPIIDKIVHDVKLYYNVELANVYIDHTPNVMADKTMIYEVFLNVIGNAIKYSSQEENPEVYITSEIIDDKVIIKIKDNGIGIKVEDQEKMFKLFSRMSNTGTIAGNGVGLTIAFRMMNRMDGAIAYESNVGEGTTFILTFKKA